MLPQAVLETIELIKSGQLDLAKATFEAPTSATTGLQVYDLEAPAKTLVPRRTPLRNSIPRVGGGRAIQANWESVTGIDTGKSTAGVPEGKRNKEILVTSQRYNAIFKTLSKEGSATLQAQLAGAGFEDVQARARRSGLHALFMDQERILIGGNTTSTGILLGTPTAPSSSQAAGGSMTARTIVARVVALTLEGWRQATRTPAASLAVGTLESRTPADGGAAYNVSLGSSNKSAEGGSIVVTANNKVTWTWPVVRGAFGYAIYTGVAGTTKLAGFTNSTQFIQTADEDTGAQNSSAVTADNSQDQYVYDGLVTQCVKSGSNAYYLENTGASNVPKVLTADTKGGITEFNDLLLDRWEKYAISNFAIYMSGGVHKDVSDKIRQGSTSTPFSINIKDGQANVAGGGHVGVYVHPITAEVLPIIPHPELPDGMVIFRGMDIPYEDDRIPNVWQVRTRLEYASVEWPQRTFKYEIAAVVDEVLQGYFPPANGIIVNILRG